MKKFLVTVMDVTEVEVELDPSEMTEEWLAENIDNFHSIATMEQHAGHIGRVMALNYQSTGDFIAGYGYVRTGRGFSCPSYSCDARSAPDALLANINVRKVSEDTKIETKEITKGKQP